MKIYFITTDTDGGRFDVLYAHRTPEAAVEHLKADYPEIKDWEVPEDYSDLDEYIVATIRGRTSYIGSGPYHPEYLDWTEWCLFETELVD